MKFLTLTVLAIATLARAETFQGSKRGAVVDYSPSTENSVYASATAAPEKQVQYVQQAAPVKVAYSAAPQYQFQAQQFAYSPAPSGYSPAPSKQIAYQRPQYSLAGDVSTFSYSSPVVAYNSLGLLTQIAGRAPAPAAAVKVAPAPVAYQAPIQKVAQVSYAPVRQYIQAPQPQYVPQQYVAAAPQQQAYVPAPQQQQTYVPAPQTYTVPQATIPQPSYSPVPQYKYVQSGVSYAQQ